jgi:hypothetical protein
MKTQGKACRWVAAILLGMSTLGALAQQGIDPLEPHKEATLYFGRGVDSNLREIPGQIVHDEVPWEDTYFTSVGLAWVHKPPALLADGLGRIGWERATTGVELVATKHRGMQDIWELGILALLRSPFAHFGPLRARIGAGLGFSYTFGTPTYEDGSEDEPNRRWRFQNYNAFEVELGHSRWRDTTLVARLHHRSGLYGLIAPKRVGSNFMAVAVRHQF